MMRFAMLLAAGLSCFAQANDFSPQSPAFAPVADQAGLPRVLLIGDSISIGYTVTVRTELAGKANVHRIPENGADTANGLKKIDDWLGDSHWDVIHFNWGLHDLKVTPAGGRQVDLEDIREESGRAGCAFEKDRRPADLGGHDPRARGQAESAPRGGRCGPLQRGCSARDGSERNCCRRSVRGGAAADCGDSIPGNVHFNAAGWELLGRQVAGAISTSR